MTTSAKKPSAPTLEPIESAIISQPSFVSKDIGLDDSISVMQKKHGLQQEISNPFEEDPLKKELFNTHNEIIRLQDSLIDMKKKSVFASTSKLPMDLYDLDLGKDVLLFKVPDTPQGPDAITLISDNELVQIQDNDKSDKKIATLYKGHAKILNSTEQINHLSPELD